eukprot:GHVR01016946.1.p1 GENE.GHVR01016946.1~~GHVR01016946.1.p1  ORF type:complete len:245 (+),score=122.56 GHVR01016946.1:78-812(+)
MNINNTNGIITNNNINKNNITYNNIEWNNILTKLNKINIIPNIYNHWTNIITSFNDLFSALYYFNNIYKYSNNIYKYDVNNDNNDDYKYTQDNNNINNNNLKKYSEILDNNNNNNINNINKKEYLIENGCFIECVLIIQYTINIIIFIITNMNINMTTFLTRWLDLLSEGMLTASVDSTDTCDETYLTDTFTNKRKQCEQSLGVSVSPGDDKKMKSNVDESRTPVRNSHIHTHTHTHTYTHTFT